MNKKLPNEFLFTVVALLIVTVLFFIHNRPRPTKKEGLDLVWAVA